MTRQRAITFIAGLGASLILAYACPWPNELREYLSRPFWLPFAKTPPAFERPGIRRIDAPFAGMRSTQETSPLAALRLVYQGISQRDDLAPAHQAFDIYTLLSAARANPSLSARDKEELDLIDAKIDLRTLEPAAPEFPRIERKLKAFLNSAKTPEFVSEARGWLGRYYYLKGNQTAAGKIYLDELNRPNSNLSRETILNSLRMTYGYDGGPELVEHLEEYFDTPEHAAFAIELLTNPDWERHEQDQPEDALPSHYPRLRQLLEKHAALLRTGRGAASLLMLNMRLALRMGDPESARALALKSAETSPVRGEPDFLWMLASANFLTKRYAEAADPLIRLHNSKRASGGQRAAAAYGLCGVYQKVGDPSRQLYYALALHNQSKSVRYFEPYSSVSDLSVYWATSGWDLGLLLEGETPLETLEAFAAQNPQLASIGLVKYSLAVRLARENRYAEAAGLYRSVNATRRADRMDRLDRLYRQATDPGLAKPEANEAKFRLAEFIGSNPDRLYFNDRLWGGFQNYALNASTDARLTRAERGRLIALERKIRDDQEERWRAFNLLREIARDEGPTPLGRRSARLATQFIRGINPRFGRTEEVLTGDRELTALLRKHPAK
jgi:hypothetical protein